MQLIEFCRLILSDIKDSPHLKVIITSRYGYINLERLRSEKSLIIQLNEFTLNQQKNWLDIFRRFHPETPLTKNKLEQIHNSDTAIYLKELIGQPILLHMIASLEAKIDLTTSKFEILIISILNL